VIQSIARYGLSDHLEVHLDHVRMPAGNGGVRTKGRSLDVMSLIKYNIVTVKAAVNCLACALIIAMERVIGDPKYKPYGNGIGLKNCSRYLESFQCEALRNFSSFNTTFRTNKLLYFNGLKPDRACLMEIHVRARNYIYYIFEKMSTTI